jgi:predicted transcriptional regulator
VSEEELRKEAVRRRQAGESAEEVAVALGRTSRWVRKWSARAETETDSQDWAAGHSRAPLTSPTRTAAGLRQAIIDARARLVANPRGQLIVVTINGEIIHDGNFAISRLLR